MTKVRLRNHPRASGCQQVVRIIQLLQRSPRHGVFAYWRNLAVGLAADANCVEHIIAKWGLPSSLACVLPLSTRRLAVLTTAAAGEPGAGLTLSWRSTCPRSSSSQPALGAQSTVPLWVKPSPIAPPPHCSPPSLPCSPTVSFHSPDFPFPLLEHLHGRKLYPPLSLRSGQGEKRPSPCRDMPVPAAQAPAYVSLAFLQASPCCRSPTS